MRRLHTICLGCWTNRNEPGIPMPDIIRFDVNSNTDCCFCRKVVDRGFYVEEDPAQVACQGNHT